MKYLALLLLSAFLFVSCSESKMLVNSLNKYQAPLYYLHDTKIKDCDKTANVALTSVNNDIFDSIASVSKLNHKVLPFIIYNYEEINLGVNLGQSLLEQDYTDFFKDAFTVESQRTGCYSVANTTDESSYSLEITCDTCKINSTYQRNSTVLFLLFAYSMSFQELGFPAETDLVMNAKLKKGSELVFEKVYSVNRIQPFVGVVNENVNQLRSDFVTNMVESLSLSTKDCIEQIVRDVNLVIDKHEVDITANIVDK